MSMFTRSEKMSKSNRIDLQKGSGDFEMIMF